MAISLARRLGLKSETEDERLTRLKEQAAAPDRPPSTYVPPRVSNEYVDELASQSKAAGLQERFRDSMKLISSASEGDELIAARQRTLESVKVGDTSLKDLGIQTSEIEYPQTDQLKQLKSDFDDLNLFLGKSKRTQHLDALITYLSELKSTGHTAFEEQIDRDCIRLREALEGSAELIAKLPDDPAIAVEGEQPRQKAIEAAVTEFRNKQLENLNRFNQDLQAKLRLEHETAQMERDRISFLAMLDANSAYNQRIIEAARSRNNSSLGAAVRTVNVDFDRRKCKFTGVEVKDLPFIETLTGRKIRNSEGTLSMTLPNHWLGFAYHASSRQKMLTDLTTMARAIKATGSPTIEFTLTDKNNPDRAKEAAQAAYEACRLAGYADKDIKITFSVAHVNEQGRKTGQVKNQVYQVTTERNEAGQEEEKNPFRTELYANKGGEQKYQAIQERAQKYDTNKRASLFENTDKLTLTEYKERIQSYKAAKAAPAAAAAAAAAALPDPDAAAGPPL